MSNSPNYNKEVLWEQYVKAHEAYIDARVTLHTCTSSAERVELTRKGFQDRSTSFSEATAYDFAKTLSVDELKELFCILVGQASSSHGRTGFAQDLILKLPHDWLIEHIEACTEKILEEPNEEYYWCILALYHRIGDDRLTLKLAQRAAQSEDEDIRDAGETYLERLQEKNNSEKS